MPEHLLWAPQAWVNGGWQQQVLLGVSASGHWSHITPGVATAPPAARILAGPVLPGLVNAHSHAFQRAFAGLSERRASDADDFWSWRDRMYGVALRITPAQMRAVAAQLYLELLRGGYTQVCEFHYLHHDIDGSPYADPITMCRAVAEAAQHTGIGLTLLPVLYERAGFSQPGLRDDQRRFRSSPMLVDALANSVQTMALPRTTTGVAVHSLRAASGASIRQLQRLRDAHDGPIHIHVAEQTQEVDDCVASTGARPIAWLCQEFAPDRRWQLVHATHATRGEIDTVARSGAGIVICPSTEGNLGDGWTDLPHWLACGVPMAIGSDSHVTRNWPEELRWLEYGQRLQLHQRNVAAAPAHGQPGTAARLFNAALEAGGRAAGLNTWGLVAGARADALVLDSAAGALLGLPDSHALDALVFAGGEPVFHEVMVAGEVVLRGAQHVRQAQINDNFCAAMRDLWAPGSL